jgi:hypothetical protein
MNKKYNLKLDLQFRCNNSTMKFDEFDNNTSDFFIRVTRAGELIDISKAIVTLVVIKPDNSVDAQFVDIDSNRAYCDLKPTMKNLVGKYEAIASITVDGETVNTGIDNPIIYEVTENKFLRQLNQKVVTEERFTLLTDMINRLSTIEISEEQRVINEAERILSEENRKIEEAKRVEVELIRQHEEADRAKYDATRESNENIRKINEEARISSENVRLENEANRIEQEANRVKAEQLRKDNYNLMTEDEERRRSEANAHKEAEALRVSAENTRVNEEAKRRTTEQARVSAENTRVSNENTRKTNEVTRQTNETKRVEAETQRQNRYNSFIADAEANANNFENYTNSAKIKEEERKSNELDRKSQEDRRVSNEVERISNENTRKANEAVREKNEASRQNTFTNKVNEVDKKIVEMNTAKDNFISSINTKVDNKISEIDKSKSDMTNTVSNKVNEVETRFNALTSKQQQDAEVIDARDGETSLKARLDRDIEKAKQVYVNIEGSNISTDSSSGYAKDVEILGNTIQDASNLADIRSVGDKVEGQELYEIPVLSVGKNLLANKLEDFIDEASYKKITINLEIGKDYILSTNCPIDNGSANLFIGGVITNTNGCWNNAPRKVVGNRNIDIYIKKSFVSGTFEDFFNGRYYIQLEEGTVATPYEPYVEDKLTILSPTQLEKVGDVRDRIIEKNGVFGVEKNIETYHPNVNKIYNYLSMENSFRVSSNSVDAIITPKTSRSICNLLIEGVGSDWTLDKQCCYVLTNNTLVIKGDIRNASNLEEAREWIKSSGLYVKYPTTQPQFIPLPHSQQVKLRTFANKTNISFGCEIEGTIKAQVPKSLGATVNTHTEQINNLNKELDRVKKLEESTVSTVTTESDFTTVEATSNGYFEDVKLEGKTLVNLISTTHSYISSDNTEIHKDVNTDMTTSKTLTIQGKANKVILLEVRLDGVFSKNILCTPVDGVINTKVALSSGESIRRIKGISAYGWNPSEESFLFNDNFILLEGDHTQNPPSGYIEGLKSVGQNVDEIVVSSTTNEFTKDFEYVDLNTKHSYRANQTVNNLIRASLTNISNKIIKVELFNRSDYSYHSGIDINPNQTIELDLKDVYIKWISFDKNYWVDKYETTKYYAHLILNGKADKKRLLYYNEETQTWEKPILREWDSIEKHANGKYYYHVRSKEGDYVEGDESLNDCITDLTVSVKKLAEEKVYECTNIDLITYANETNYIVECGAISPKTTLKVHNNISNVVSLLQKKVSLLESDVTSYMITQNRLMLASRYNADNVTFKVDYPSMMSEREVEIDYDLFKLIQDNIIVGPENYDVDKMLEIMDLYAMIGFITWEMWDYLYEVIDSQINPVIGDLEGAPEI